jgi:hypothetical protein
MFFATGFLRFDVCFCAQVITQDDVRDLINCLIQLQWPGLGLWGQARHGTPQHLDVHLFINHNGVAGHTAIRINGNPAANRNAITVVVAGVIAAINNEIIRRANWKRGRQMITTPIVLDTLLNASNQDVRLRPALGIMNFFKSQATKVLMNGMRCFLIAIPSRNNLQVLDGVTVADNGAARMAKKLAIWLPANVHMTAPRTVYLR